MYIKEYLIAAKVKLIQERLVEIFQKFSIRKKIWIINKRKVSQSFRFIFESIILFTYLFIPIIIKFY